MSLTLLKVPGEFREISSERNRRYKWKTLAGELIVAQTKLFELRELPNFSRDRAFRWKKSKRQSVSHPGLAS